MLIYLMAESQQNKYRSANGRPPPPTHLLITSIFPPQNLRHGKQVVRPSPVGRRTKQKSLFFLHCLRSYEGFENPQD